MGVSGWLHSFCMKQRCDCISFDCTASTMEQEAKEKSSECNEQKSPGLVSFNKVILMEKAARCNHLRHALHLLPKRSDFLSDMSGHVSLKEVQSH